jgi:hypothetical protein
VGQFQSAREARHVYYPDLIRVIGENAVKAHPVDQQFNCGLHVDSTR